MGVLNLSNPTDVIKWIYGGKFNLSGNCNSLIFCDDADNEDLINNHTLPMFVYQMLFRGCEHNLIKVSKKFLPSKRVSDISYYGMCEGCTSLVNAPELPATTLVKRLLRNYVQRLYLTCKCTRITCYYSCW